MKIRPTFWAIVFIAACGSLGALFTGLDVYYRLIYLSGLLLILGAIWTIFATRGLAIARKGRGQRQEMGQVFEERYEVTNNWRILRLWIEIRDHSDLPGNAGSRFFSWIGGREKRTYTVYTVLRKRGEYSLGPTEIISNDPFGLFAKSVKFEGRTKLLVLPQVVDLDELALPAGLLPGGKALRRKTTEVTPYAAGVREYAPGDSLSRIHWRSTARRDQLMVKEFEEDPQTDVWILLDGSAESRFWIDEPIEIEHLDRFQLLKKRRNFSLPNDTFEYGVSAAASVGRYFLKKNQTVGFASSGQASVVLPPERGERQLGKLLEMLAFIRPEGRIPLHGVATLQAGHIPRGSTVIMVTSATDASLSITADTLLMRHMQPAVILIDPESFGDTRNIANIQAQLINRGVPTVVLKKDQSIKEALQNGFSWKREQTKFNYPTVT